MNKENYNKAVSFLTGFTAGTILIWGSKSQIKRAWAILKYMRGGIMPSDDLKMVLVVRTDLDMSPSKITAQCSHAVISAYKTAKQISPDELQKWRMLGQPKVIVGLHTGKEQGLYNLSQKAKSSGILSVIVKNTSHTEIPIGTPTVLSLGPALSTKIDTISRNLKLL